MCAAYLYVNYVTFTSGMAPTIVYLLIYSKGGEKIFT